MRLLLVEDDVQIFSLISKGLNKSGFTLDSVATLTIAEAALCGATYDAIILDLDLPDGGGLKWLSRHQRQGAFPPVLVITACTALGDRIVGLDAGADDYLTKPFAVEEVAARLRALLRRPGPRGATTFAARGVTFDAASRKTFVDGAVIQLTKRETDLLELLIRYVGSVVSKRTIETKLYNYNESVTPNAVEVLVSRLRRKLKSVGATSVLCTVRGTGYLIEADPK